MIVQLLAPPQQRTKEVHRKSLVGKIFPVQPAQLSKMWNSTIPRSVTCTHMEHSGISRRVNLIVRPCFFQKRYRSARKGTNECVSGSEVGKL